MSFITDIATLAKAGYTPQDVKDLLSLSKSQEPLKTEAQPAEQERAPHAESTQPHAESVQIITEPDKSVETSTKEIEQPTNEPDYKALYEAEPEKVKALQIKNKNADVSQISQSKESDLLEAIKSFC